MNTKRQPNQKPKGFSLLEVVVASALMAFALVPALTLFRDGMRWGRDVDSRAMLLNYGVCKMEEQLAIVAATWTTGTAAGDFSTDGHANIRYSAVRSDSAVDGGITSRLMAVTVTIYDDADSDDTLDVGEMQLNFTTKIGKLATYEAAAGS